MENLILSFEVVLPLLIMMMLGLFLRSVHLVSDSTVKQLNNVVFRVFLPVLLFCNVYHCDLNGTIRPRLMIFAPVCVIISFFLTFAVICLAEKINARRGVLIQGIFRSNFIIFGLPVTISLYGEEAGGIAALLIAVIIPIFNVFSVAALEIFSGSGKFDWKKILKGIVTNPLIIASVLALIFLFSGLKIPTVLDDVLTDIGSVATPLGLMILGASFAFSAVRDRLREIIIGVAGKLVIVPAIFLPIAIAMGFRDTELVALLALFGSPTAVSSFTMAQQMGGDSELAGHLVVLGSLFSIITMFFWIFALKQLGFI